MENAGITGPGEVKDARGNKPVEYYWIECWEKIVWTKRGLGLRFFYTFMHSNGNKLATSQPIDNRKDRDNVVKGILVDGFVKALWTDWKGNIITHEFCVR